MGDRCRPKYFGARKLSMRLGEKREVQFCWQASYAKYYSACLTKGFFYISNSARLKWVDVAGNEAAIFPATEDVYPSASYLSLTYGGETLLLPLAPFILYPIPTPPTNPPYPLITSKFSNIFDEAWLPANSKFKFSDN